MMNHSMSSPSQETSSREPETPSTTQLGLLPAPSDAPTKKLDVGSGQKTLLDELGPMVVNSDGTLSRIANWSNMTEAEQERTLRVLGSRNRLRLAARIDSAETDQGPKAY
ncbi:hypothetical protein DFJ43DRAFT_1086132 [Lentinula guzmanii]|uniref:Uncharacterized protein n=1 Tax=Lentinula guzmanii TaxID=2804957 RepID=A0AA38JMT7_9AGAR|nr:hypothetical protein DFJ43DRAFT_1086132 [Lentinula guzmanii]